MRPVPGWARYATPVPGLYLCGAGAHPGGGVTGAPGYNAARRVLADLRREAPAGPGTGTRASGTTQHQRPPGAGKPPLPLPGAPPARKRGAEAMR